MANITDEEIQKLIKENAAKSSVQKKSFSNKCKELFISKSFGEAVTDTIVKSVVPGIKQMIVNGSYNVLQQIFGTNVTPPKFNGMTWNYMNNTMMPINYTSFSNQTTPQPDQTTMPTYQNIVILNPDPNNSFSGKASAERILDTMQTIIDRSGSVSISHFMELAGRPTVSTYYNYGWRSLRGAGVEPVTGGWHIILPIAELIKK
ncbi:MAG: hypothetical protein J6U54_01715 [Clostridiales bacterium]|nr:hypothetical protein [Clostridiales bacterium]